MRSLLLGSILIGIFLCGAQAQNAPASDLQAVALAQQSIAATVGKSVVSDVTLTGNVTWNGEGGTFKLSALGNGESRMDLTLPAGTRTEIRDAQTGVPIGAWVSPNTQSGRFAGHNCGTDAAWFFPVLGALAAAPNVVLTYIGPEIHNGAAVQHLHAYTYQASPTANSWPKKLSAMDFYLDGTTSLPVATMFNVHPDNDANTNLLVEIDFANYQPMNGALVPMHIQRYQQGNLMLDFAVTGVTFNSGLPLSLFAVN